MSQKQQIVEYWQQNGTQSFVNIAAHFSAVFNKTISDQWVYGIIKNRSKFPQNDDEIRSKKERQLMDELYNEFQHRMSLGGSNEINTQLGITSLATGLANDIKYEGFFSNYKFDDIWTKTWRHLYKIPESQDGSLTVTRIRYGKHQQEQDLRDELFFEIERRMKKNPKINSQKGITSLAFELASHEKYEGFFRSYKFSKSWTNSWRELYNIPPNPSVVSKSVKQNRLSKGTRVLKSRRKSTNDQNSQKELGPPEILNCGTELNFSSQADFP